MLNNLLKRIGILLAVISLAIMWYDCGMPKICVLCDNLRYHAPCLVALSTGELIELELYKPHPSNVAEIIPNQTGETFRFLKIADAVGYSDTTTPTAQISFPIKKTHIAPTRFCKSCRNWLADYAQYGFVLADMYEANALRIFPFIDGALYKIRCYEISVMNKGRKIEITVTGTLVSSTK